VHGHSPEAGNSTCLRDNKKWPDSLLRQFCSSSCSAQSHLNPGFAEQILRQNCLELKKGRIVSHFHESYAEHEGLVVRAFRLLLSKKFFPQPLDNQNKLPTFAVLKLRDKNINSLKGKNAYYPTIS
jgi:hypothetical protein